MTASTGCTAAAELGVDVAVDDAVVGPGASRRRRRRRAPIGDAARRVRRRRRRRRGLDRDGLASATGARARSRRGRAPARSSPTVRSVVDAESPSRSTDPPSAEAGGPDVTERAVLVIGGAGFIGSHLVDRLIAEGESVDVVDDLSTGRSRNLAECARGVEARRRRSASELRIHTLDACADELRRRWSRMRRPDEIYHLALLPPGRCLGDACSVGRSRRCSPCSRRPAGRASPRSSSPCRRPRCTASRRARPAGQGGRARAARRARRRRQGDRRPARRVPRATGASSSRRSPSPPCTGPASGPTAASSPRSSRRPRAASRADRHGDGRQTRDFVYVDDVVDALVRCRSARQRARRQRRHRRADVDARPVGADRPGAGRHRSSSPRRPTSWRASPCRRCGPASTSAWSPWTTLTEGLAAIRAPMDR